MHFHFTTMPNTPTIQRPCHGTTLTLSTWKHKKPQYAAFLVRQNLISHQRWVKFYVAASEKRGYTYTRTKGDKQVGLDLSLETDHAAACFQQTVRLGVLVH